MTTVLWIVVGVALVTLVALQFAGAHALARFGVRQSRATVALRALNVVAAVGIVAFAFWSWRQ